MVRVEFDFNFFKEHVGDLEDLVVNDLPVEWESHRPRVRVLGIGSSTV